MEFIDHYSLVIALNHLTDAIQTVTKENWLKDYIMPIFAVIISSVTAYFIAIRGYQFQEASRNERLKVDALNKIILQIQCMQSNLITIKQNYACELESHPLQRALNVPIIPANIDTVVFSPDELPQLLYSCKVDIEKHPWMNIASFVSTFGNYNQVVKMLFIRNEHNEEVKKKLAPLLSNTGANGEVSYTDVVSLLDGLLLIQYIDITEKFICMVDNLLITMNDFLVNFPKVASKALKKKYLKSYVYLTTYENQNEEYQKNLVRCKEVNIDELAHIMKLDKEEIRRMYIDNSSVITTPK